MQCSNNGDLIMKFDLENTLDYIKDGTEEVAESAHEKTSEFHNAYVSKVIPDCGKYGNAAKFMAEMIPGVAEYNAIVDGDWTAFAIAAGIDIGAVAVGALTAGTGYAVFKSGSKIAKTGTKIAAKEITESCAQKVVKEIAEESVKKVAKETIEVSSKKAITKAAQEGIERTVKETVEVGAKSAVDKSVKKAVGEGIETGTKKVVKETAENEIEQATKETVEKVVVEATKEVGEKLDKKLFPEYLKEVQTITKREISPIQLEKFQKVLKEQDFVKLNPEKAKLHRKLFDNARDKLIDEWEIRTVDKWPVYAHDILNDAGEVIRKEGQRFDAHHLIESSYGGPNAWWNLFPAAFPDEHQGGIHAINSYASKIFHRG